MTFRCSNCHGVVWIPHSELQDRKDREDKSVRCRACSRQYDFGACSRVRTVGTVVAKEARDLARENGIDLPLAYSVALGIMRLEEALRACQRQSSTKQSGKTVALRPSIVKRRRATDALRWVAYVVVILAGIIYLTDSRREAPVDLDRADLRSFAVGEAKVLTDARGRVLRVHANDPRSVLRAFCRVSGESGRLQEIEVVPPSVNPEHTRIGLLRDPVDPDNILAITITVDVEKERWVVGDGRGEVVPEEAPHWTRGIAQRGSKIVPATSSN